MSNKSSISVGEEFPLVCETCLGDNPYVRMVKLPYGVKLCKISNMPFQGYKWKAGTGGRYKETVISYVIAKERNICQVCMFDMQYGLPVGVRDQILNQQDNNLLTLPSSLPNMVYHYNQLNEKNSELQITSSSSSLISNNAASRQLTTFAQIHNNNDKSTSKIAFRNLPKLCSFWVKGNCERCERNSCTFRPCCGSDYYIFPELASNHYDLNIKIINDLKLNGPLKVMKTMSNIQREELINALKTGNKEEAIKKRLTGEDNLTKKYLAKIKSMELELPVPNDITITTLFLGNIEPNEVSENDIRDIMYAYGHITGCHIIKNSKCAFVEYATREMAEYAAKELYNNLIIHGKNITVNWAKPKPIISNNNNNNNNNNVMLPPPPGLDHYPISNNKRGFDEGNNDNKRIKIDSNNNNNNNSASSNKLYPSTTNTRLGSNV